MKKQRSFIQTILLASFVLFGQNNAMEEDRSKEKINPYIRIQTLGKEDSACGFSAAWITSKLNKLLTRNPNASIENIIQQVGPSEKNKQNFKKFTKTSADYLLSLLRKKSTSEKVKQGIQEGKQFAEKLFSSIPKQTANEARKYVTMNLPYGEIMVEMLKNQKAPLQNIIVYLDGLGDEPN